MHFIKTISTLCLFSGLSLSNAFAPSKTFQIGHQATTRKSAKALISRPLPGSTLSQNPSPLVSTQSKNPTQLNGVVSDFVNALENIPEGTDLTVGAFIIFCAVTPYFLGLFFADKFDETFFMKIYGENDEDGRVAELQWKKMYATLGLTLTSIQFYAFLDQITIETALRHDYIAWTLFFIAATTKLAVENRKGLIAHNYVTSQVWHLVVALVLTADLLIRPDSVEFISKTVG